MKLAQGAEAIIERTERGVRKTRLKKTYRHPDLDATLRKSRTKREHKVLKRLAGLVPEVLGSSEYEIELAYVDAPLIKDALTEDNAQELGVEIGKAIKEMHERGVVHHDLTTSNMFHTTPITLIDFGLAQFSDSLEDRAVDLHVLKQALGAKHPDLPVWEAVLTGYEPSHELIERLEEVERRGRYKNKG